MNGAICSVTQTEQQINKITLQRYRSVTYLTDCNHANEKNINHLQRRID